MSVASDLYKYISKNIKCAESKGEYYVEVANQYPHLHSKKEWLGFSRSYAGSNTLVNGDKVYWNTLDELRSDPQVSPSILEVLNYVDQTYKR